MDVICQAKSGMGKTAVFVLAVLQQLEPVPGEVGALILCHTRELAYQICHEFERFSAYLPNVNVSVVFGGINIKQQREELKEKPPSVIVATPGRLKALAKDGDISLKQCGHFILDECDKMLEQLGASQNILVLSQMFFLSFLKFFSFFLLPRHFFSPLEPRTARFQLRSFSKEIRG